MAWQPTGRFARAWDLVWGEFSTRRNAAILMRFVCRHEFPRPEDVSLVFVASTGISCGLKISRQADGSARGTEMFHVSRMPLVVLLPALQFYLHTFDGKYSFEAPASTHQALEERFGYMVIAMRQC